jgi:hypothetical protein
MLQLVPRRKARSVRTFATRYPRPLDERISAHGWLQLRCRQVRGERAVGRGQLLPLQALPASQRNCSVGQRPSRIRHVSDRRRRGQAASLETRRRWGEMVLRRLWLFAVWPQPQPRRSNRHPHGNIRPRSRDPAKRPPVRRLRRTLGADPRRRTAPAPRKPPLSRLTVVRLGQPWCSNTMRRAVTAGRSTQISRCYRGVRVQPTSAQVIEPYQLRHTFASFQKPTRATSPCWAHSQRNRRSSVPPACHRRWLQARPTGERPNQGMELSGFEPLTSWVRSRRSPN